jgi:Domain of unknown function (DUF4157)
MSSTPSSGALRGPLRARAEAFFEADLSSVHLSIDGVPGRVGAVALARGDTVHLAPSALQLPPAALDELVGHELAHVLQQREGRARPRRTVDGLAIDDDPVLEAEARALGRRFAQGRAPVRRARRRGQGVARREPVAQRAVSIGGTAIAQGGSLTERARLALTLVDGGLEWLHWAASSATARFDFADEPQLVAGVQIGLHASPHTLLPRVGLLVSPYKLMTLGVHDLRTLVRAEQGAAGSVVEHQVRRVLRDNDLLTTADLATVQQFLADVGVASAPVVSALGLDAQIAVYGLVDASRGVPAQDAGLQKEAAAFAVSQARTPSEFCDFYKAYVVLSARLPPTTPERRADQAERAVQVLQPLFFADLEGPQLGGPAGPVEAARVVAFWLASGKQLGFARLSLAVEQVIEQTGYEREIGESARHLVSIYLHHARHFLAAHEPTTVKVGQDGLSRVYRIESEHAQAELELSASGIFTLRSFHQDVPPPPAPPDEPPAPPAPPSPPAASPAPSNPLEGPS